MYLYRRITPEGYRYIAEDSSCSAYVYLDEQGHKAGVQARNVIHKGMVTQYGKISDIREGYAVVGDHVVSSDLLNDVMLKSLQPEAIEEPEPDETRLKNITGHFDTHIGRVKIEDLDDSFREVLLRPDNITETDDNGFVFAKTIDNTYKSIMVRPSSKSIFSTSNDFVADNSSITIVNDIPKQAVVNRLLKGIAVKISEPKFDKKPLPGKYIEGQERPGHKYIQRKLNPAPKTPKDKYIYLYELPSGKRQWQNARGETVKNAKTQHATPETLKPLQPGADLLIGDRAGRLLSIEGDDARIMTKEGIEEINLSDRAKQIESMSKWKNGANVFFDNKKQRVEYAGDYSFMLKDNAGQVTIVDKPEAISAPAAPKFETEGERMREEKAQNYEAFLARKEHGFSQIDDYKMDKMIELDGEIRRVEIEYDEERGTSLTSVAGVAGGISRQFQGKNYNVIDRRVDPKTMQEVFVMRDDNYIEHFIPVSDYEEDQNRRAKLFAERKAREGKKFNLRTGQWLSEEESEALAEENRNTESRILKRTSEALSKKNKRNKLSERDQEEIRAQVELKAEQEKKYTAATNTDAYIKGKEHVLKNGFTFQDKLGLNATKSIEVNGNKYEFQARFDVDKADWTRSMKKGFYPTVILPNGEEREVIDITETQVFHAGEDGSQNILEPQAIEREELRAANGKNLFKPSAQTDGIQSSHAPHKVLFHEDEQNNEVAEMAVLEIVDASKLITSHRPDGQVNDDYRISKAQARDRSSDESQAQVLKIAKQPRIDMLLGSGVPQMGAPVVNEDGQVISGNGRTMGLTQHYEDGRSQYKADLMDKAQELGIDKCAIESMERPILIQRVAVDNQRAELLGSLSNADLQLSQSGGEKARGLAGRFKPETDQAITQLFKGAHGKLPPERQNLSGYFDLVAWPLMETLERQGIINSTEMREYYDTEADQMTDEQRKLIGMALLYRTTGNSAANAATIGEQKFSQLRAAVPHIYATFGTEGDLREALPQAFDLLAQWKGLSSERRAEIGTPQDYAIEKNADLFNPDSYSPAATTLFRFIETATTEREITSGLKEYAIKSNSQFFGDLLTIEGIMSETIEPKLEEQEKKYRKNTEKIQKSLINEVAKWLKGLFR